MISVKVFNPTEYSIYPYGTKYSDGNNQVLYSVKDWAKITKADWVFNEAFFNFVTKANDAANCSGRTLQYLHNSTIGDIGYGDKTIRINFFGNMITGWATAVSHGQVQPGLNKIVKRARNMDGITVDGRYIHVTTDRQTEYFVANYVNSFVKKHYATIIKYLFIQDSGGSTSEYSNISKLGYYPEGTRALPNCLCITRKAPYVFTRTLKKGTKGKDVEMLQMALTGFEVDGIFGNGTFNRLKQSQKALGLVADGIAGPKTIKAMGFTWK